MEQVHSGICESGQFPLLTMGVAREAKRLSYSYLSGEYIHGVKLKVSYHNRD